MLEGGRRPACRLEEEEEEEGDGGEGATRGRRRTPIVGGERGAPQFACGEGRGGDDINKWDEKPGAIFLPSPHWRWAEATQLPTPRVVPPGGGGRGSQVAGPPPPPEHCHL